MAQSASTARSANTLRSRTMPAPPLESEPAITRTAGRPGNGSLSEGDQRQVGASRPAQGLRGAPGANAGAAAENHARCCCSGKPLALDLLDGDAQCTRERRQRSFAEAAQVDHEIRGAQIGRA